MQDIGMTSDMKELENQKRMLEQQLDQILGNGAQNAMTNAPQADI